MMRDDCPHDIGILHFGRISQLAMFDDVQG